MFFIEAWFDLLPQLFAPFENFLILFQKKTLANFPTQSSKDQKKLPWKLFLYYSEKKISHISGWLLIDR